MNKKNGFTVHCTLITKGILVLLLLFHHVFYGNTVTDKQLVAHLFSVNTIEKMAMYGKICVGGFAFLSAYGMTCKLKQNEMHKGLVCFRRVISFESSCIFIYCIALIYKRLIIVESIRDVYRNEIGEFCPIYMGIDCLGLAELFRTPKLNVTWWYCSFAILLIFSIPAIYVLYSKMGIYLVGLSMFLSFNSLITVVVLGVAFAEEGWFDRIDKWVSEERMNRWIATLCCGILMILSWRIYYNTNEINNVQFWTAPVVACLVMIFFQKIPVLNFGFKILGKYSSYIFLSHTFIYYYFYEEFIYSFREVWCIYLIMLLLSFLIAIIIDVLRKISGYNCVIDWIQMKVEKRYMYQSGNHIQV